MELLREFLKQVGALQQVWAPFLLAIFVVGVVIWRVLKHHYQGRLDTKADIIQLRDAQLQDYKDKLSGATPDEAKARLDALEARIDALSPRRITGEQRDRMLPALDTARGHVSIASDGSSADSAQLARVLAEPFRQAGWFVNLPMVLGIGNPPATGVAVIVPDPANLTPQEKAVTSALSAAQISFDLQVGQRNPHEVPDIVHLLISTPLDR